MTVWTDRCQRTAVGVRAGKTTGIGDDIGIPNACTAGSADVTLTEPGVVWDQFPVFHGHKVNSPYIRIGKKGRKPRRLKIDKHPNALKRALCFRELLDSGQADSQGDLSRRCGIPRTTITAYLRLLDLDAEVQACLLQLDDSDPRLQRLTEARLRHLHGQDAGGQRLWLNKLLSDAEGNRVRSRRIRS